MEEVAKILEVKPEWLAYGVAIDGQKTGRVSHEGGKVIWVPEIAFGDDMNHPTENTRWGIPAEYLAGSLRCNPEQVVLCVVDSHAVEPEFEYGNTVFVDRAQKRPSPSGVFLYWDGLGAAFGKLQVIPGEAQRIRITQKGQEVIETDLSSVTLLGRVTGRIQRG